MQSASTPRIPVRPPSQPSSRQITPRTNTVGLSLSSDFIYRHIFTRVSEALSLHDDRVNVSVIEGVVAATANAVEVLQAIVQGDRSCSRIFFVLSVDPSEDTTRAAITDRVRIMNSSTDVLPPPTSSYEYLCLVAVVRGKEGPIVGKEPDLAQDIHVLSFPACTGSTILGLVLTLSQVIGSAVRSEIESVDDTHRAARDHVIQIVLPQPSTMETVADNSIGHQKASQDIKLAKVLEDIAIEWCNVMQRHLDSRTRTFDVRHLPDDVGPMSEVDRCENDLLVMESIMEQIDVPVVKLVCSILRHTKTPTLAKFEALKQDVQKNIQVMKEVVRYLRSLIKYFEVMHTGCEQAVREILGPFMQNAFLINCASPEFFTDEWLTVLFVKVGNQLINNCKNELRAIVPHGPNSSAAASSPTRGGSQQPKLWDCCEDDVNLRKLLSKLKSCVNMCRDYQDKFHKGKKHTEDTTVMVRPLKLDGLIIFGKMELFCKRLQKLMDIFAVIELFRTMRSYQLEGFSAISDKFFGIVDELRRRCPDLLDYTKPAFDKEYVEFNRSVVELESTVQVHINSCFENNSSTLAALDMLVRFRKIFSTEALKIDLASKEAVILHNFSVELENVQKVYEAEKEAPPTVRFAPPVVGPVLWARHLLHLIEEPMTKLQSTGILLSLPRESKRVTRNYNILANALVQYEMMYVTTWTQHVENARAGLDATIFVPKNGTFVCNFDRGIDDLLSSGRWLKRIGVQLTPAIRSTLRQEKRIRSAERNVNALLSSFNDVLAMVHPVMRSLLLPCINHVRSILSAGETSITWSSLTLEDFVSKAEDEIDSFRRVILRINDIVENRIQYNLKLLSELNLVDVLKDRTSTVDQYVSLQKTYFAKLLTAIQLRSKEIENATVEACSIARQRLATLNLVSRSDVTSPSDFSKVLMHFNRLTYKALLNATTTSFQTLRHRISTIPLSRMPFTKPVSPMFETHVELHKPSVVLHPSVDEVQLCVNQVVSAALNLMKGVGSWASLPESRSFYEEIARNKEVVKVVLFLTGALYNLRNQVNEYLSSFDRFSNLWSVEETENHNIEWDISKSHTLEEYIEVLTQNNVIEADLKRIPTNVAIGVLQCDTSRLVKTLLAEVTSWKQHFGSSLHHRADSELDALAKSLEHMTKKLHHKVTTNELSDVRVVFDSIQEVRDMETAGMEAFARIESEYQLLGKFEIKINKDVFERLSDLKQQWSKIRMSCTERQQEISAMQHTLRVDFMESVRRFGVDIITFRNDFVTNGPMCPGLKVPEAVERLKKYMRLFGDRLRRWENLQVGEDLFGLPRKMYPELSKTAKELDLLDRLFTLYVKVTTNVTTIMDTLWVDLKFNQLSSLMQQYMTECKRLPAAVKTWESYKELKQIISDMADVLPVLEQLGKTSIKERHWRHVMEICGTYWKTDADVFKLRDVVEAKVLVYKDDILDLATASDKECELEVKLKNVELTWKDQVLVCTEFKHRGPIILKGDEVIHLKDLLEETHVLLGSMMSSRFVGPFRSEVSSWIEKLTTISETLELWTEVQALWMYLEAVFSGGDIVKQLPHEAKRFALIDKQWSKIMYKANEVKSVLSFCYGNEVLNSLPYLKEQLESLQRQLSSYLEQKRNAFSRFYFISDGVLLEILSQSSDPAAIQGHLSAMFDGVARVSLLAAKGGEPHRITTLHAPEGEAIDLLSAVSCYGNVEDWLQLLCGAMRTTMKAILYDASLEIQQPGLPRMVDFIRKYPAQVSLSALLMLWTSDVTQALSQRPSERKECGKRINVVREELTDFARGELDAAQRIYVEGLIVLQVHNSEVWELIKKVRDVNSFEFQRQLRCYWSGERNSCVICMTDVVLPYCYEYLGIKERLVMTGLTDRCYITLCQAIAIYMGGAPTGPAGTGKTETVKDLARSTGNYVVVFNCSDQWNFKGMAKIFKGLAQSGAWGCFDEFNRIDLPVLSVVAQQVQCIFAALKQRKGEFSFTDGSTCRLVQTTAIFVTMNPGYAGRQELPENLKVLFRTVSMMVPERDAIMKVKLASAGYKSAGSLAKKFLVLYSMCEHQLSKQHHYDFGLRNVLSVLRSAGNALRSSNTKDEEFVFVRTLQEMNLSKLVHADIDLFQALLNDVFPNKMGDGKSSSPFMLELSR
eukprot:PhF_6_TR15928/c0_g1_i1/m.24700/K10408/DNAH; dynein heavy chain, axonemal